MEQTNISGLPPIIELKGVHQTYFDEKKNEEFVVFNDFNMIIPDIEGKGQFVTVMGESGCGKSTILQYCTNLRKPTTGEIFMYGKPLGQNESYPMVFQNYSSLDHFSILDNVALPLTLKGMAKKEREEIAMRMIQIVGLEKHAYKFASPRILSGGQLQRIAIARSLVANPNLIFLDEPFGALDPATRTEMQFFLLKLFMESELADRNPTVVLVTHDPREAVLLGNDVYIMGSRPGRIIQHIQPELPAQRDKSIRRSSRFVEIVGFVEELLEKRGNV